MTDFSTKDPYGDELTGDHILALFDIVGRTGASSWELRFSEPDEDEEGKKDSPVAWLALAGYPNGTWMVGADMHPLGAAFNLAEKLLDGGKCMWCDRPSGISNDFSGNFLPGISLVCFYIYDPELKRYERSCRHTHHEKATNG